MSIRSRGLAAVALVATLLISGQAIAVAATGSADFLHAGTLGTRVDSIPGAISCTGSGACVVGGSWNDYPPPGTAGKGNFGGLLDTELRGTWGPEKDSRANNAVTPQNADYTSVSCFSTGNCVAGGYFEVSHGVHRALVANEVNGKWKTPTTVPGLSKLGSIILNNLGGATSIGSAIYSVSCGAKGDCLVGGSYADKHDVSHAFTASIVNGVVQPVRVVIGKKKPSNFDSNVKTANDVITQVSCGASTDCVITGTYQTKGTFPSFQSFVQVEQDGVWSAVRPVFAPMVGTQGANVQTVLSCPTASYCTLVGSNDVSNTFGEVYVTSEHSGSWSAPVTIPGLAALSTVRGKSGSNNFPDLVCTGVGNCLLTGEYSDGSTVGLAAYLAQETNGVWARATPIPGLSAFAGKGGTEVDGVSCSSSRNCVLVGSVTPPLPSSTTVNVNDHYPFVVAEVRGLWSAPSDIPGLHPTPATADIMATGVSCAHNGTCAFLGSYVSPFYVGVPNTAPITEQIVTYTFGP